MTGPVLLFDGVCNLCNTAVAFILRFETESVIRFASLQSNAARTVLADCGLPPTYGESLVLKDAEGCYGQSLAVLRAAYHMGGPWRAFWGLRHVPEPVRDGLYRWISRNRYAWFGRRETCRLPAPEERSRFLD